MNIYDDPKLRSMRRLKLEFKFHGQQKQILYVIAANQRIARWNCNATNVEPH